MKNKLLLNVILIVGCGTAEAPSDLAEIGTKLDRVATSLEQTVEQQRTLVAEQKNLRKDIQAVSSLQEKQLAETRLTNKGISALGRAEKENTRLVLESLRNTHRQVLPADANGVVRAREDPVEPEINTDLKRFAETGELANKALENWLSAFEKIEKFRGVDREEYRRLEEEKREEEAKNKVLTEENAKLKARKSTIINNPRQETAPPPTLIPPAVNGSTSSSIYRSTELYGGYAWPAPASFHDYYPRDRLPRSAIKREVYLQHHTDATSLGRHFAH